MLSYQHAYHAGNLADVHKHGLLAWMLGYMTARDKPLTFVETHAGRGLYDLAGAEAAKTGEAAVGIARAAGWFADDHPYARALALVRAAHGPDAYPGSPLIATSLLRAIDRIVLAELHPQEFAALKQAVAGTTAQVEQRDGADLALSLCPPTPARGLLLIDPSYEVKTDYATIPRLIAKLHRKWPVGVIVLWYPILIGAPHAAMMAQLTSTLPAGVRHEVSFPPARPGHRMIGSGLFVLNPPFGFEIEAARLSAAFAQSQTTA